MWFLKEKNSFIKWYKLSLIVFYSLTVVCWAIWFSFIIVYITKGITIEPSEITIETESVKILVNAQWEQNVRNVSSLLLSLFGLAFILELGYLIIIGRQFKQTKKLNVYELIVHSICAIGIFVTVIISADKLIKNHIVIFFSELTNIWDIQQLTYDLSQTKLYAKEYGFSVTSSLAFLITSLCFICNSCKKHISIKNILTDCDIIIIVFTLIYIIAYPEMIWLLRVQSGAVVGEINFINVFDRLAGTFVSPILSILSGSIVVLEATRLILYLFLDKKQMQIKSICIYSVIIVITIGIFILAHSNGEMDLIKLLKNELFKSFTIVWTLLLAGCLSASIYGAIGFSQNAKNKNLVF